MLALACTLCHSTTGEQVRAQLLGADLVLNAAAAFAPAPAILAAWWLLTRAPHGR